MSVEPVEGSIHVEMKACQDAAPTRSPAYLFGGLPSDLILRCFKGRLLDARQAGKNMRAIVDRVLRVNIHYTLGQAGRPGIRPDPDEWPRMGFSGRMKVRELAICRREPRQLFWVLGENDMAALCAWLCNSQSDNLESLTMKACVDEKGALLLAAALKSCQKLRLLDLSSNRMGDGGLRQISQALQQIPSLEDVDLQGNLIGNAGLSALLPLLKKDGKLTYLKLQGNPISRSGHEMLEECGVQHMRRVFELLAPGESKNVHVLLRRLRIRRCWSVLCWRLGG